MPAHSRMTGEASAEQAQATGLQQLRLLMRSETERTRWRKPHAALQCGERMCFRNGTSRGSDARSGRCRCERVRRRHADDRTTYGSAARSCGNSAGIAGLRSSHRSAGYQRRYAAAARGQLPQERSCTVIEKCVKVTDYLCRRLRAGIAIAAKPAPRRSIVAGSGTAAAPNWTSSRTR